MKTPEDIERIQSWIKTDEEIEQILFWDNGGKFNDPIWRSLKPVDDTTQSLLEKTTEEYKLLRKSSVEYQRRSDLTLLSQFIPSLLFSGVAGAVRYNGNGSPDSAGEYFKGIELRCIGSVEDQINSITIFPVGDDEFEIHFGSRADDTPQGISVYTGDSHSLLQLAQFINRKLGNTDFVSILKNKAGEMLTLDPKIIRRAVNEGETLDYEPELQLFCSIRVKDMETAFEKAADLQKGFYERFGLEVECYNIGKKYGNFHIMREDNFDRFLSDTGDRNKGLVLLTATLVCRRCRRELEDFRDMARSFPDVTFALVNLNSPQFKFYERVFGDMSGGDVKNFRKTAVGVTPFVIIYRPDESGILKYSEYLSSEKAESPQSKESTFAVLKKYFS